MHDHLNHHVSTSIVSTAWWQVVLALIVAFSTALSAHYFYERRKRREITLTTAAQLISAARQLRRNYLGFAEYVTDFNRQQMAYLQSLRAQQDVVTSVAQALLDSEHLADVAKTAADSAKSQSEVYQREILASQNQIDKSYFLLLGLRREVREDKKLKAAIEALLGYKFHTFHTDMNAPKDEIEALFKPNLAVIQKHCGELMESSTKSWVSVLTSHE